MDAELIAILVITHLMAYLLGIRHELMLELRELEKERYGRGRHA
jgi:hypothetical protein